jgi:hypothetical protein
MLRLSLTYALLDSSPEMNVDHVTAAYWLWSYCEQSARLIFGASIGDPVADRLLEAALEAGDRGLSSTAQHHLFHRHVSGERLEMARRLLEDRGLVITIAEPTEGRPRSVTYPWSDERAREAATSHSEESKSANKPLDDESEEREISEGRVWA